MLVSSFMYYISLAVPFSFEFDTRNFKREENYRSGKKERRRRGDKGGRRKEIPLLPAAPFPLKRIVFYISLIETS